MADLKPPGLVAVIGILFCVVVVAIVVLGNVFA